MLCQIRVTVSFSQFVFMRLRHLLAV